MYKMGICASNNDEVQSSQIKTNNTNNTNNNTENTSNASNNTPKDTTTQSNTNKTNNTKNNTHTNTTQQMNNNANNNNNTNNSQILKLELKSQNYAWGKPGETSKVAKLLNKNKTDSNTPYAELWMGTHKNGPSKVIINNKNNNNNENNDKNNENQLLSEYLGGDLPYLFKILSIARSLSIQVHPNKTVAAQLHAERPNIYKDSNHKPEMAVALTQFEAMCGFRPYQEICHFLQNVTEFANIVGNNTKNQFITMTEKYNENNKSENKNEKSEEMAQLLKELFSNVMKAEKEDIERELDSLITKLTDPQNPKKIPNYNPNKLDSNEEKESSNDESNNDSYGRSIEINELILRINKEFPKDVGIFAVFILNCFKLNPNEAVFLSANLPHAYLSGDCIECMACSDNVVRAGLTPKLRDTDVLCQIVEYVAQEPQIMSGDKVSDKTVQYAPDVGEFRLMITKLDSSENEKLEFNKINNATSDHASILLIYEGNGIINDIIVNEGDCLLVPNTIDTLNIKSNENCAMRVARCFTPKV